jgi:stage V sporulation protein G
MEITEVKVYPANEGKLRAYATMVIENCFIIRDMKLIQGESGLFVSMPSRRRKDGTFKDVAHPLNQETRQLIEQKVVEEFEKTMAHGGMHTAEQLS